MSDLSLEDFMNHDRGSGGGGGKFLRGWRKLSPPQVDIWLHTRALFSPLWQHNIPQVRTIKDKDTQEDIRVIWSNSFNCLENPKDAEEARFASKGEYSPKICPLCKLIEHVRAEVNGGRMKMTQPIFKFDLEDGNSDNIRVLHAAGIYNGFGAKNLNDKQKAEMRAAKINLKESWKENWMVKCNYVFAVADNAHPENGVQIAIETSLLGDKMKAVLRQEKERQGDDGPWNPLAHPYAFRWKHHPSAVTFNDKYEALAMPSIKLSDEVRALITDDDPPDLTRIKAPGKASYQQEQFERYALVELPWEEIFGAAVAAQGSDAAAGDDDADFNFGANADGEEPVVAVVPQKVQAQVPAAAVPPPAVVAPKPAAATTGRTKVAKAPAFEPVYIPCDDCQLSMREDEAVCRGCGSSYEVDAATVAKYAGIQLPPKAQTLAVAIVPPAPASPSNAASQLADETPGGKPDAGTHGDSINW